MIITIASFGYKKIIQRYFPNIDIITPGYFDDGIDGIVADDDKNNMIEVFMKKYNIKSPTEVLLVDDSQENIAAWRKFGGYAYEIRSIGLDCNPIGITIKDANNIIDYIKLDSNIKMIVYDADFTLFNLHVTSRFAYPHILKKINDVENFEDKLLDDLIINRDVLAEGLEMLYQHDLL
jgi:hypothetical protein